MGLGYSKATSYAANYNVSINPFEDLAPNTQYYLTISDHALKDSYGNPFKGISDSTEFSFLTGPAGPLVISTWLPNYTVASNIEINFSDSIHLGSGEIVLHRASDNSVVETFTLGTESARTALTISDKTLSINPSADLVPNAQYTLTFSPDAITDISGNRVVISSPSTQLLNFTAPFLDIIPPELTPIFPIDNQTHIAVDSNISLVSYESIKLGQGTIELHKSNDHSLVEAFSQGLGSEGGTALITNNSTLEINPHADLLPGTQYYLTIGPDVAYDLSGNAFKGFSDPNSFNFKTATDPAAAIPNLAGPSNNLAIDGFSPATIPLPPVLIESNTTTIGPPSQETQTPSTPVAASVVSTVETAPTLQPTEFPASLRSDRNDLLFRDRLELNFNEAIQLGNGEIQLHNAADDSLVESFKNGVGNTGGYLSIFGSKLTVNPSNELTPDSSYYLTFSDHVIRTQTGSDIPAIAEAGPLYFKVASLDTQAPTLISKPPNYTVSLYNCASLSIEFNEGIKLNSGKIEIHKADDQSLVTSIDLASGLPTTLAGAFVSNSTLLLSLPEKLAFDTQYYVTISDNTISDYFDNSVKGVSDSGVLNFTTPGPDRLGPELLDIQVPQDLSPFSSIELKFNEYVKLNDVVISLHQASDNHIVETFAPGSKNGGAIFSSKSSIFIDPNTELLPNTQYYFTFDDPNVTDDSDNAMIIPSDISNLSFISPGPDQEGPVLQFTYTYVMPYDHFNVTTVNLSFNESVKLGKGEIVLHQADGTVVETFSNGIGSADGYIDNSYNLRINTFVPLKQGESYYVTFGYDALTDTHGNTFVGVTDPNTAKFIFQDYSQWENQPLALQYSTDNQIGMPVYQDISLQFNHEMKLGNGAIVLHNADDGTIVETYTQGEGSDGGKVVVDNGQILINPGRDLNVATQYYLTIENGALLDSKDEAFKGFSDVDSLNFFTAGPDHDAPQLIFTTFNDDINYPALAPIMLNFNDDIQLKSGVIELHKASDNSLVESFTQGVGSSGGTASVSDTYLLLDPFTDFAPDTAYYLTIADNTLSDRAGNAFAGFSSPTVAAFQTLSADATAPQFAPQAPIINLPISSDLQLYFYQSITLGSGVITLHNAADGSVVESFQHGVGSLGSTASVLSQPSYSDIMFVDNSSLVINPHNDLLPDTAYYVTIDTDAITDNQGNHFAGLTDPTGYRFSTEPLTPYVVNSSVAMVGNSAASDLEIDFNKNIQLGTGDIVLHKLDDGSVVETFSSQQHTDALTVKDNSLIINPSADLIPNSRYYLTLATGAVIDTEGHESKALSDPSNLSFIAPQYDHRAPEIISSFPIDNQTHIAVDAKLSLWFDECVKLGQGHIDLYKSSDHSLVESFVQGIGANGGSIEDIPSGQLLINPQSDLEAGTQYYLTVSDDAITDLFGNAFAGISDQDSFNFKTATDPNATFTSPNDYPIQYTGLTPIIECGFS